MSSWFKTGKDGVKESTKRDAEAKVRSQNKKRGRRFWLKHDTKAKVTFLDTPTFFFGEHKHRIGNDYNNFFTCNSDCGICPFCDAGIDLSFVVAGTIIDHSVYIAEDGTEYRDQKKLIVLKGTAKQHVLNLIELQNNNLQYCLVQASRGSGQKECSTGEDFQFIRRLNKQAVFNYLKKSWDKQGREYTDKDLEEFLKPFKYEEIFAPLSVEDMRRVVGGDIPVGSSSDINIDSVEVVGSDEIKPIDEELTSLEDLI